MKYTIKCMDGFEEDFDVDTLRAAKSYATRRKSLKRGSIYLWQGDNLLAKRLLLVKENGKKKWSEWICLK
jgi:hypothetical protein